jgi:hypothetical protein
MTVSGSKNFELDVTEYIEEAFERCGREVRTGYDIKTAKRSMNLLFADWANRGLNSWTIEQSTQALTAGTANYTLNADTIDILSAAVRRDNVDYNIQRLSRDDYLGVPNKTTQGRPSQWFLDRLINPVLKLWPVPENSTDVIVFDRLVRMDDADTAQNTVEMPFRFYPCLAAGLAYYIAIKKAPDRVQLLKAVYEEEMERAISMDRDRASFNIVPSLAYSQNL